MARCLSSIESFFFSFLRVLFLPVFKNIPRMFALLVCKYIFGHNVCRAGAVHPADQKVSLCTGCNKCPGTNVIHHRSMICSNARLTLTHVHMVPSTVLRERVQPEGLVWSGYQQFQVLTLLSILLNCHATHDF